jgi:hypothetical protein
MTPIEQVTPTLPGNWPRRIENRNKRDSAKKDAPARRKDRKLPGTNPGERPDGHEHIVDELA